MPEVCEVLLTSQYLLSKLKDKYITKIEVISGKYKRLPLKGIELIELYQPLQIIDINTKGKFMWFELSGNGENTRAVYILNTFGLTGEWSFQEDKNSRIVLTINSGDDNKQYKLYYGDPRNFGNMEITTNRAVLDTKLNSLAPDLLKTDFTTNEFINWVRQYYAKSAKRGKTAIVAVLLEQEKKKGIGCGIGNYLSSEILYRAKISPHRPIDSLNEIELIRLANATKKVLKLCYMSNITGYMKKLIDFVEIHKIKVAEGKFPDFHPDIVLNDNDKFEFLVYGRKVDENGHEVLRDNIAKDRMTYWVPETQK